MIDEAFGSGKGGALAEDDGLWVVSGEDKSKSEIRGSLHYATASVGMTEF